MTKERKDKFWDYLSTEVQNATSNGAGMIIQMDGNLWAGRDIIPEDPKPQNQNGKRFADFLLRNKHLSVVNATKLCEGKFTRVRNTTKTIIDFFIVCDQILPLVSRMKVDEEGEFQITRYKGKTVKSDHNMLKLEINLEFHKETKHDNVEVFNVRNKTCQEAFCQFTSKDNRFSKCFSAGDENINVQFNRWKRQLNKSINACFKKIRLKENNSKEASKIDKLIDEKKEILKRKTITQEDIIRIENIEKDISNECEDKELEKLEKIMSEIETNKTNIWKEMRKAYPNKTKPIPTGVKDIKGRVITNPSERKQVTLDHFNHRMRKRPVNEDVKDIVQLKYDIFEDRLKETQNNRSPPFNMR